MGAPPFSRSVERPVDTARRTGDEFITVVDSGGGDVAAANGTVTFTFGNTEFLGGNSLIGLSLTQRVDGSGDQLTAAGSETRVVIETIRDDLSVRDQMTATMDGGALEPNDLEIPEDGDVRLIIANDSGSAREYRARARVV